MSAPRSSSRTRARTSRRPPAALRSPPRSSTGRRVPSSWRRAASASPLQASTCSRAVRAPPAGALPAEFVNGMGPVIKHWVSAAPRPQRLSFEPMERGSLEDAHICTVIWHAACQTAACAPDFRLDSVGAASATVDARVHSLLSTLISPCSVFCAKARCRSIVACAQPSRRRPRASTSSRKA